MKKFTMLLTMLFCVICLTGCFMSEEEYQNLRKIRDGGYEIFKETVYEQIDGSEYFSDIHYLMGAFVSKLNKETQPVFGVELSSEGGIYWSRWIVYMEYNVSIYNLFYLEIEFYSSMRWATKKCGKYLIKGE